MYSKFILARTTITAADGDPKLAFDQYLLIGRSAADRTLAARIGMRFSVAEPESS